MHDIPEPLGPIIRLDGSTGEGIKPLSDPPVTGPIVPVGVVTVPSTVFSGEQDIPTKNAHTIRKTHAQNFSDVICFMGDVSLAISTR